MLVSVVYRIFFKSLDLRVEMKVELLLIPAIWLKCCKTRLSLDEYTACLALSIEPTTVDYRNHLFNLRRILLQVPWLDKQLVLSRIAAYLLSIIARERGRKREREAIRISFSTAKTWQMKAAREKLIVTWVNLRTYQIEMNQNSTMNLRFSELILYKKPRDIRCEINKWTDQFTR